MVEEAERGKSKVSEQLSSSEKMSIAVPEALFNWADGPKRKLSVFSPEGERIEPRWEILGTLENGDYRNFRVHVPYGSIIVNVDYSDPGHRSVRVWHAVAGRPELLAFHGKWSECFQTWPDAPAAISETAWRKLLRNQVREFVIEQWEHKAHSDKKEISVYSFDRDLFCSTQIIPHRL